MKFYALGHLTRPKNGPADTEWLPIEGAPTGDAPCCPNCGSYLGARPLLPVVDIELKEWGEEWGDFAYGIGDELLMSERTRDVFQRTGITGFDAFLPTRTVRAMARKRGMPPPPTYVAGRINRGCAVIDEVRSGFVRQGPTICSYCRTGGILDSHKSIHLELGSWGGCDIFYAWGLPGTIFVSDRFRSICLKEGISNVNLVPAEECVIDPSRPPRMWGTRPTSS